MSDILVAKGNDKSFAPHPEGQFVAQCVDMIALGDKVEQYQSQPAKLSPKCALVFRTGERDERGEYIDIAREFTVSMGDLANLRQFLEQWRGRQYAPQQIEEGVPLHKLTNQHALLTIAHKVSAKGRTYANITACVGVPKQMASVTDKYSDYVRADYWADRKKEYAEGAAIFRNAHRPTSEADDEGDIAADGEPITSDLPF